MRSMLPLIVLTLLLQNKPSLSCPAENNGRPLVAANVIELRGGSEGDLAPDRERPVKGGTEQQWDLDAYRVGAKLLLRCGYKDLKESATQEIPAVFHRCTKTITGGVQRIVCN